LDKITNLKLDICITVRPKNGFLIFAKRDLFNLSHLNPEYKLFFCDSILNFNKHLITPKNNALSYHKRIFSEKLNFYSTVEDIITKDLNFHWMPEFSSTVLKCNLYSQMLGASSATFKNLKKKFISLQTSLRSHSQKNFSYKLESRVNLMQVDLTVLELEKLCIPENFFLISYDQFAEVFESSCSLFNDYIIIPECEIYTFDKLAKTIISEIVFKAKFLSGSTNTHLLPSKVNKIIDDKFCCFDNLCLPVVSKLIEEIYDSIDKKKLIVRLAKSSMMDEMLKNDLLELLDFAFSNDIVYSFINLYFKISSNYRIMALKDIMSVRSGLVDSYPETIFLEEWINENFVKVGKQKRSNVLFLAYQILLEKFSNEADVIEKDWKQNE